MVSTDTALRNPFDAASVPVEMRELPQWVVRRAKVPYNARTGATASSTNSTTWSTFEKALDASARYDGLGFVFAAEDGLAGVDLDHVIDPDTGQVEEWAVELVRRLDSYTEVSPSGTSLHTLVGSVALQGNRAVVLGRRLYVPLTEPVRVQAPTVVDASTPARTSR